MTGVAVDERQVLHRDLRPLLVIAMGRGPDQVCIAGVHLQYASLTHATYGHETAAVDDRRRCGVVEDLRRGSHLDRDGRWATVEGDDAAGCHCAHHGIACAT